MSFGIEYTEVALKDIALHKKVGDIKVLQKIDKLLDELRNHPTEGTGKPKMLKHYEIPTWSRRITSKHRLVYRINNDEIVVLVVSFWGHYDDK